MTATPVDDIVAWASTKLAAWRQDALRRLGANGQLTDSDHDELLAMVKACCAFAPGAGAPTPIVLDETHFGSVSAGPPVRLKRTHNVRNVNRLIPNAVLEFGPELTIVYGRNGSGKSGFVRRLRTPCRSRVDRCCSRLLHVKKWLFDSAVPKRGRLLVSFARLRQIAVAALLPLFFATSAVACPDCQDEKCTPLPKICMCVRKVGCKISVPVPGTSSPDSPIAGLSPIPLPEPIRAEVEKLGKGATNTLEKLGNDVLTTFKNAGGDTVRTLQKAGGDTFATIRKAGDDLTMTTYKAAGDSTATYIKGWRDIGEQGKRSFHDAIDAAQATVHYYENQAKAELNAIDNAKRRLSEGKVIDSLWGLAVEPLQSNEENFAKATQESAVINAAAASAAAAYGGPAGAAAYAAWSTYRWTGNADMAFRAGILAAATSQMGAAEATPVGTTGEILKKAAIAGAAGGISVAAAGGDEQAITNAFLKSAGAVLIQGGTDKLNAYSPEAKDAYDTVQCISARDVDCLSNTAWVKDATGKIVYDHGKPKIDISKFDPKQYIGQWTQLDPQSAEGKENAFITQISKITQISELPKTEAIILKNQWVLTWTLGTEKEIGHTPTVALTYAGENAPFRSIVDYGEGQGAGTSNDVPFQRARIEGEPFAFLQYAVAYPTGENVLHAVTKIGRRQSTFMVFFESERATLSPQTLNTIKVVSRKYKGPETSGTLVLVVGYVDRAETPAQSLSLKRAAAVKEALVREGVPETAMVPAGAGDRGWLVPTAPGVRDPQNRRVEITFVR
jgi:outer membrane protein OmpA-like peptidoglycan-associated protein